MNTLEVKQLSKAYGKGNLAVNEVSFDVAESEVFALIGPNGAGKTTTLRMISTLLTPTSGDAVLAGYSVRSNPMDVRQNISYLADEAGAYKSMRGRDYLKFMAGLYAPDDATAKGYVAYASDICALGERLNDRIGSYSRGMIRKLLLARAVMTNPKLAILDEPTSGLDILNALEIRRLIRELAKGGTSFLISSHNMLEIDTVSHRVGIIDRGKLLTTGTPDELKSRYDAQNLEEVFERVVKDNA